VLRQALEANRVRPEDLFVARTQIHDVFGYEGLSSDALCISWPEEIGIDADQLADDLL
jgi:hypothetical protein